VQRDRDNAGAASPDGPVTTIVRRRIRAGREAAFERWLHGVNAAAQRFPGHLGVNVLRPSPGTPREYVLIFHFDSYASLRDWEESDERRAWLGRVAALTDGEPTTERLNGLEYWFTLPGAGPPPARFKMALVTLLAIYPLSTVLNLALGVLLAWLPLLLRSLVLSALLVGLMTYLVMPWMTSIFAPWLFGPRRRTKASDDSPVDA